MSDAKLTSPAALRNRDPILAVLRRALPAEGTVLEIASGSGEHAVYFAERLPALTWQPSDAAPTATGSIAARRAEARLPNLRAPLHVDVTRGGWDDLLALSPSLSAIVCINMIHIAPWAACEGLLRGAARLLPPGGPLLLYGPFRFGGRFTAPSNEAFDASLRGTDAAWGVRDLDDVSALASREGLDRVEVVEMPANNHVVVLRRHSGAAR